MENKSIEELWESVKELKTYTTELKKQNEDRTNEIFKTIISWCVTKIKECRCSLPNALDLGINVTEYGNNKELSLYIYNCHSFTDWEGACFTAGRYGNDRHDTYLKMFVIQNWQEIKNKIIASLAKEQSKVLERYISDFEHETELEKDLSSFQL